MVCRGQGLYEIVVRESQLAARFDQWPGTLGRWDGPVGEMLDFVEETFVKLINGTILVVK